MSATTIDKLSYDELLAAIARAHLEGREISVTFGPTLRARARAAAAARGRDDYKELVEYAAECTHDKKATVQTAGHPDVRICETCYQDAFLKRFDRAF